MVELAALKPSVRETREYREEACLFGRTSSLSGVLTLPTHPRGMPVVLLGAGIIHKVGPSRVSVELARALAAAGHPTLRFDLSGIGDSPRAAEPSLEEAVVADIRDAITHLQKAAEPSWKGGVCLLGYCSGADNAFHVARSDTRVDALALFDPRVHPTAGFHRRQLLRRLRSRESWRNILTGRSLWLRLRPRAVDPDARPPGYYGLLICSPEETDAGAKTLVERGVQLLYVLSSGASLYCNSPRQVAESMPTGYSAPSFTVEWRPHVNHILSRPGDIAELSELVVKWLGRATVTAT